MNLVWIRIPDYLLQILCFILLCIFGWDCCWSSTIGEKNSEETRENRKKKSRVGCLVELEYFFLAGLSLWPQISLFTLEKCLSVFVWASPKHPKATINKVS